MRIKPVKYYLDHRIEILYTDNYKGYNYFIISYGTHPCAYVEIPKNHPYYGVNYMDIDDEIEVHGGLTYSSSGILLLHDTWVIGWDYAHCCDYSPYLADSNLKKWTTEEIIEECKRVIVQLKNNGYRYPYNGRGGFTHE